LALDPAEIRIVLDRDQVELRKDARLGIPQMGDDLPRRALVLAWRARQLQFVPLWCETLGKLIRRIR
jgi:hypothetical protein